MLSGPVNDLLRPGQENYLFLVRICMDDFKNNNVRCQMISIITNRLKHVQNQNEATTLCNTVQKNSQVVQDVLF